MGENRKYFRKHQSNSLGGSVDLEDQLIWSNSGKDYNVADGYKFLTRLSGKDIIWNKLWKIKAPHKVRIFLWKVENGVLTVKLFLKNRLHANNFNALCDWCGAKEESIPHLMRDFVLASWVWHGIAEWWCIPVNRYAFTNFSLRRLFSLVDDSILNKPWRTVVAASLWHIWIARNDKVFNQKSTNKEHLLNSIKV